MTWALDWFYFGDLKCLMDGGSFGEETTPGTNLIVKLASLTKSSSYYDQLRAVFKGLSMKPSSNEEWPLMKIVRGLIPENSPHPWRRICPLEIKIRRAPDSNHEILAEDFANEILLSSESLVVPWPFPVRSGESAVSTAFAELKQWLVDEKCEIPKLDATDYHAGRDFRLNSLITVVEAMVETANTESSNPAPQAAAAHALKKLAMGKNATSRWSAIGGYAASQHIRKRFWSEFQLPIGENGPSPTDVVAYPNLYLNETWLALDNDGSLRLHVGQRFDPVFEALLEPWPCGRRTSTKSTRVENPRRPSLPSGEGTSDAARS